MGNLASETKKVICGLFTTVLSILGGFSGKFGTGQTSQSLMQLMAKLHYSYNLFLKIMKYSASALMCASVQV